MVSGRNPRKVKSVRRYYDDDFDTRSTGSGGSVFSWASGTSQVYLVETTADYWNRGDDSDSVSYSSSKKRRSSKRGRSSRTSHRSHPTGTWPRHASVEDDDDDDDDDSSDDGSFDGYGGPAAGPYPHPGMMPPQGPPPEAFQPGYGMYPQHASPPPMHPNGFPTPPPPPASAMPPPPPPPGGHFVPGRDGIQVFVDG
ncbi:uncharacterized protein THITE_2109890 [Thermothielavioides terrestris NRRL 8126]|uniref:Uncharacterized protein n=1 Tax=Thermothielavioides terrestris (strain ATCC 38088 / NRRL 8126) TaxID=578455 RepID=G2QQU6_THETT|nr:uncharacterized protein THITE_2109890 [Thermothielavioides terrestris NRRL 8126]AEO64105.1 hypothetical protein THITE_2109890 [Thermothielavioides terrestris NRRL 8126]